MGDKTKSEGDNIRRWSTQRKRDREGQHCMARHGMSRVLSWSCRGIQTWLSPSSLQYPLWHFLWCEWGRIHSDPTQVVYCFCLRRLTQRPRLRTRLASLCRRPVLAGDSCHASGKTLGRQLIGHFLSGFYSWRFFLFLRLFRHSFYFSFLSFFFFWFRLFRWSLRAKASLGVERVHMRKYPRRFFLLFIRERNWNGRRRREKDEQIEKIDRKTER